MALGVVRVVWGYNERTGKWDGPWIRGWLPAIYRTYRYKVRVPRNISSRGWAWHTETRK